MAGRYRRYRDGWFSLDIGIDVEGERVPLLPILVRLLERGGIEGMPVTDGRVHAPLDDGRLVALPAERVGKLLAIIAEMADAGRLNAAGAMVLPAAESASIIDLEPLATTRWENAAAIRDYARKLRAAGRRREWRRPPLSPRRCGHISNRVSIGCRICAQVAWQASSPTIWDWGKPRRPLPT